MQWTVVADVLRAVAAGLSAVIATLKFIYDIRHKQKQQNEETASGDTPPPASTADTENANTP